MNKILNWLTLSSADVTQGSLFIKGLVVLIPSILVFSKFANIQLDSDTLTTIINTLSNILLYISSILMGIVTLYGLLRKIILTMEGKNVTPQNPTASGTNGSSFI